MHPMSPTMSYMVAEVAAAAHRAAPAPVDPAELERYTHRALRELVATRPRITDYLPELAFNRVLAFLDAAKRLNRARPAAGAKTTMEPAAAVAQSHDICRTRRQHCWPVSGTRGEQRICRCSGRMPDASAWNARRPWQNAAQQASTAA